MQPIFLNLVCAAVMVTAADFLANSDLFSDIASSTFSLGDGDSDGLLDYNDNSRSNMFLDSDDLEPNIFAENDCAIPPESSSMRRIRARTDQCSGTAPQLQIPTLDGLSSDDVDGSALELLNNEEICSRLVFARRNIPICSSGNPLDKEFVWADYGYRLDHCNLCTFSFLIQLCDGDII